MSEGTVGVITADDGSEMPFQVRAADKRGYTRIYADTHGYGHGYMDMGRDMIG